VYIDGFSGPGVHMVKKTGEFVLGSPLNALGIVPPFREHYLIDLDGDKVENLRALVGSRSDVHLFTGDCNKILLERVFPNVRWDQYRRGLCLLDPYGLHLDWEVLATAGRMRTMDVFLNFPTMDMNRNALWRSPGGVATEDLARMTAFWGDESWQAQAYRPVPQLGLFGDVDTEKASNDEIAEAFRKRLRDVAGFAYVPKPIPMRNSTRAVVYYLFFASHKSVATKIIEHIFERYGRM